MATLWQERWVEVWTAGRGTDRSYCGIAETEDGYAVDVFHGDTCVDSSLHRTKTEAEQTAQRWRARFQRTLPGFQIPKTEAGTSAQAH